MYPHEGSLHVCVYVFLQPSVLLCLSSGGYCDGRCGQSVLSESLVVVRCDDKLFTLAYMVQEDYKSLGTTTCWSVLITVRMDR